jgi:hypothetical protein
LRPTSSFVLVRLVFAGALLIGQGCGRSNGSSFQLSAAALRDPAACQGCHPAQFAQWSGSMHAHAADDPVFLAMNKRGQRETNGALGDFCVKCHAPMAVAQMALLESMCVCSRT